MRAQIKIVVTIIAGLALAFPATGTPGSLGDDPPKTKKFVIHNEYKIDVKSDGVTVEATASMLHRRRDLKLRWFAEVQDPVAAKIVDRVIYEQRDFAVPKGKAVKRTFKDTLQVAPGRYRVRVGLMELDGDKMKVILSNSVIVDVPKRPKGVRPDNQGGLCTGGSLNDWGLADGVIQGPGEQCPSFMQTIVTLTTTCDPEQAGQTCRFCMLVSLSYVDTGAEDQQIPTIEMTCGAADQKNNLNMSWRVDPDNADYSLTANLASGAGDCGEAPVINTYTWEFSAS